MVTRNLPLIAENAAMGTTDMGDKDRDDRSFPS